MNEEIKNFFENILDKLFPLDITCFLCGEEIRESTHALCNDCEKEIKFPDKICLRCGTPIYSLAKYCLTCKNNKRYFKFARSLLIYENKVASAIKKFKYENKKFIGKYLAKFMAETFYKYEKDFGEIDYLIAVPLYPSKQKERGFNQSEILADELSKIINIPVLKNNLVRIKNTQTQTKLSYKERQENLENAFKVLNWREIKNKRVILIDDVLTTGSTINHCSMVLKNSGAKEIFVITAATTDSKK